MFQNTFNSRNVLACIEFIWKKQATYNQSRRRIFKKIKFLRIIALKGDIFDKNKHS